MNEIDPFLNYEGDFPLPQNLSLARGEENWTFNCNFYSNNTNCSWISTDNESFTYILRKFGLPVICVIGLIGNTLTILTFFDSQLWKMSCSRYLAVRALVDNCFILTIIFVWLDFVNIRIFHTQVICQMILTTSYFCSFLSVWCVVFVTCENYIRISHYTKVNRYCTVKLSKYILVGFSILGFMIFSFPIWTTEVVQIGSQDYCITKLDAIYINAERILVYLDSFLTLLLPMILVLILMFLTLRSAKQALKRHKQRRLTKGRRRSPQNQVAKLLTAVSLLFILLHLPSHTIRLKVMIQDKALENYVSTDTDRTVQHVFSAMYYLNFDVNWIVYLVSGAGFRRVFLRKICKYSPKDQDKGIDSPHCSRSTFTRNLIKSSNIEMALGKTQRDSSPQNQLRHFGVHLPDIITTVN